MLIGTQRLFREDEVSLILMFAAQAGSWFLCLPQRDARALRAPVAYALVGALLVKGGEAVMDVRLAELVLVIASGVLPAVAVVRERLRPGALPHGLVGIMGAFVPIVLLGWLLTRAFAIPAIACAQHLAEHGEVHQRWRREYGALLRMEAERAARRGESRYHLEDADLADSRSIELVEAPAEPGSWAFTVTPLDCPGCRSFYLDSNDVVRTARRRRAIASDRPAHPNELQYLEYVVLHGCIVLGDYACP